MLSFHFAYSIILIILALQMSSLSPLQDATWPLQTMPQYWSELGRETIDFSGLSAATESGEPYWYRKAAEHGHVEIEAVKHFTLDDSKC